jgi:hypothetical protein
MFMGSIVSHLHGYFLDLTVQGVGYTEAMTGRRALLIVAGLLIVGVGAVFLVIGLDKADKVASVIGALVGLAGLGLSVWMYLKSSLYGTGASKWRNVHVADSTMVHIGDGGTMEATFGVDPIANRSGTASDDEENNPTASDPQ